jgi:hypothetical protein
MEGHRGAILYMVSPVTFRVLTLKKRGSCVASVL